MHNFSVLHLLAYSLSHFSSYIRNLPTPRLTLSHFTVVHWHSTDKCERKVLSPYLHNKASPKTWRKASFTGNPVGVRISGERKKNHRLLLQEFRSTSIRQKELSRIMKRVCKKRTIVKPYRKAWSPYIFHLQSPISWEKAVKGGTLKQMETKPHENRCREEYNILNRHENSDNP